MWLCARKHKHHHHILMYSERALKNNISLSLSRFMISLFHTSDILFSLPNAIFCFRSVYAYTISMNVNEIVMLFSSLSLSHFLSLITHSLSLTLSLSFSLTLSLSFSLSFSLTLSLSLANNIRYTQHTNKKGIHTKRVSI